MAPNKLYRRRIIQISIEIALKTRENEKILFMEAALGLCLEFRKPTVCVDALDSEPRIQRCFMADLASIGEVTTLSPIVYR